MSSYKQDHIVEANKKVSSVEWYAYESNKIIADALRGYIKGHEWHLLEQKAFEQAKAMHKEEIIAAYAQGFIESEMADKGAEQYYNQKFGGNK